MFVGRTIRDNCLYDYERGFVLYVLRQLYSLAKGVKVVHVLNVLDVPSVSLKTLAYVFAESQVGVPINSDGVVIIEVNQFAQLQKARYGSSFGRYAFHKVAVAAQRVR